MYSCIMDLVEKCIEPQYLHYSYLLSQILNAQKYGFHLKKLLRFFIRFFHVKLTDFPSSIFHTFFLTWFGNLAWCWKITEKVAFNIASEASYVYTLSGQKFIKIAKIGSFWRVFEKLKLGVKQCFQTYHFLKYKNWWKMP